MLFFALTKTSGSDGFEALDVRELEVEVVRQVGPQEEDVNLLFRHRADLSQWRWNRDVGPFAACSKQDIAFTLLERLSKES